MKKKIKRILSVALMLFMIIGSLPVLSFAKETSIAVGDTITLGNYNGKPMEWICVLIDDNGPLMLSKDILCDKEYDAPGESAQYHSDGWGYIRKDRGSNCWEDSNIRQWLNSADTTVAYSHCNPSYADEKGFLANFSENELKNIKTVKHQVSVNIWETKRTGYCDSGRTDSTNPFRGTIDYNAVYQKAITDTVMLLDFVQVNKIWNSRRDLLKADTHYYTSCPDGNNYACYEHVYSTNGSNVGVPWACNKAGIRPAFYLNLDSGKTTPNGYNFLEDSYQFSNFGTYISKKYFTTMFGKEKGRELWKSYFYQSGVCFGMSYTTAAIYNGLPDVERFAYIDEGFEAKFATEIRDLNKSTLFSQGATVSVGGNYNDYLTLNDYIKYAHIYQFSLEFAQNSVKTDVLTIYNIVKSYLDEDRIGVSITIRKNSEEGHEVLAIGIDGNNILVDDPNNTSSPERIEMGDNGYWSFSGLPGWSSDTCTIEYSLDTYMPYKALLTGKVLVKTDENEEENYVSGMDTLAKDKLLLTVENSNSEIDSNDILEINPIGYTEDTSETAKQYWLMNDKSISVSNTGGEENEVRLAGNGSVLTASVSDNSDVTMTLDGQKAETKIDTVCGNEYTVSVIDFNDAEEAIEAKITGTAAKDTVTATKTEDGVTVSGLSDITITYLKDDTEFADAKADAPDGQKTDISIDENDNISVTEERSACTHICHKGGISKVFYKIARFFWKLFKINKYCSCGAAHY